MKNPSIIARPCCLPLCKRNTTDAITASKLLLARLVVDLRAAVQKNKTRTTLMNRQIGQMHGPALPKPGASHPAKMPETLCSHRER
jgi:hypothetical protein